MQSLIAAQQLLTSANSGLTAAQQQQLLAQMSSSLSQLSAAQQQQLLASLMGSTSMGSMAGMTSSSSRDSLGGGGGGVSGLTPAQQQLLAAAGTSLTSVSGGGAGGRAKDYSGGRAGTPTAQSRATAGLSASDLSLTRPPQSSTPTGPGAGAPSLSQLPATNGALDPASQTKYQQLLSVIEEMSKDIRPCYAGSKSSAERLKRGIVYARILVRECLVEAERSARN